MTTAQAILLGASLGYGARPIVEAIRVRVILWRMTRAFGRAQERMRGCAHADTFLVDVGVLVPKCRGCWAIKVMFPNVNPELPAEPKWTPNCASPESYVLSNDGSYWTTKGAR